MSSLHHWLAFILVFPALVVGTWRAPSPDSPSSGPTITATGEGLIVEWRVPKAQITPQPDGTARLSVPGYGWLEEPGAPRLPFTAILVSLPPGESPNLEVVEVQESQVALPYPIELAGRPQGVLRSPDGQILGGAFEAAEAKAFSPDPVVLQPLGTLRGVSLARLVFYPARPVGTTLRLTTHLRVIVRFRQPAGAASRTPGPVDPLLASLLSAVANPSQVESRIGPGLKPTERAALQTAGSPLAAIEVTQAGLTALTYEALLEAGFPVGSANPQLLRLSREGIDIPTELEGDGDASFEPGERLLFYAAPRFSRWTSSDVYFLRLAETPGPGIPARAANPAGLPAGAPRVEVTAEKNNLYTPECYCAPVSPGRDGDRWVWERLQWPDRASASFSIDLPATDTSRPARLDLWLIGYTDTEAVSDHRLEASLNGVLLGKIEWDGKAAVQGTFSIPGNVLRAGNNDLSLAMPGLAGVAVEGTWLDAFSIQYARGITAWGEGALFQGEAGPRAYPLRFNSQAGLRAYDVSQPDQPVRLTGLAVSADGTVLLGDPAEGGERAYWVTTESGILSPSRLRLASPLQTSEVSGADYLILTPAEFIPALNDLIVLRQSQGLKVAVEEVQAIYDAYGGGRPEPEAIRNFLAHTYAAWSPRPTYVLLVGDGTADPKRYNPASSATFIPPYLAEVDPWAGETAADNRYVTLEGDDNLPEMLVGRLPVNSLEETRTVVEKIVHYELSPTPGHWNNTLTFVADDPDGGGNFYSASDTVINVAISPPQTVQRLYYTPPEVSAAAVRQGLQEIWSRGTAILTFTGHASIHQWAVENFFHLEDVNHLSNGTLLPVVLELTCFTGSFHMPGFPTLDEALLRHPQGGAVAVWGPTGLGIATGHESLATGFLSTVFQEGQGHLGAAALAGKIKLAVEHPAFLDLVDTYTLFGDPATSLNRSGQGYTIYFPQILSR